MSGNDAVNAQLPPGWLAASFSDVAKARMGPTILAKDLSESGLPVYSAGKANTAWGFTKRDVPVFPNGTIVVSARGSIGFPKIPKEPLFTSTQTTIAITPSPAIGSTYLQRFLQSSDWAEMSSGAAIPMLTISMLGELAVPLAPLAEQKRIADKLEAVLGRVDACRARLDRVPALLKRFRQSVLAAATSGKLTEEWREAAKLPISSAKDLLEQTLTLRRETWRKSAKGAAGRKYVEPEDMDSNDLPEIPKSWLWASADSVSSQVTDGEHIQPPYQSVGLPMLSAKHVRDGFVDAEGAGLIAMSAFEKALERCAPQNGDLLIVSVGATTGRVAIVENCEPFAIVRSVLLVKPLIPNRYFLRCLQSPWCFQRMTNASGASAQAHLYIKDTKRLPIPIPPLPEQQEIVRRVEDLFALADRIEARLATAQKTVERLTPATLAKAFRGELVPQDPNDEPASTLLERLRCRPDITPAKAKRAKRS